MRGRSATPRRCGPMLRRVALALVIWLSCAPPHMARAEDILSRGAQALIVGLDFDEARTLLAGAAAVDPDNPQLALERARLSIYEQDCDLAATILTRADVQRADRGGVLGDIARNCQRVTAALRVERDEAHGIEIRWQDEHDAPLGPLLVDTVLRARAALTRDLGVDWPRPTRIVVVRDLLSLADMTGLPYQSAVTTGTVAVAKWGRVTLLSPRASRHGLPWRDTVAHELTHLAVTRATRDAAPLWLQEGVAKNEEVRWRDVGPFDDRPPADAVVERGIERGLGLSLDKLGPSIAMLPSAEAAGVAFAEVTSFIRFFVETAGPGALPRLLEAFKEGKESNAALQGVSGADLREWEARWRAYIGLRPRRSALEAFGLAGDAMSPEVFRDMRDRSRLAQLLLSRGHPQGALDELDRIGPAGAARGAVDPAFRWLRGRALEMAGRGEEADPLVADPAQVTSSYGPWWALRGRRARTRSDETAAGLAFFWGLSADPLEPEVACEAVQDVGEAGLTDAGPWPSASAQGPLCAAARARAEPVFEDD